MNRAFRVIRFVLPGLLAMSLQVRGDSEFSDLPEPDLAQLKQHVELLSADELNGRDIGSSDIDVAARYISTRLRSWGLQPVSSVSDDGSFFQNVPLEKRTYKAEIFISSSNSRLERIEAPLFRWGYGKAPESSNKHALVFAGYGITDQKRGYNDYRSVDVEDKFVVIFRHEPNESDPESLFDGTSWTEGATFRSKYETAKENGAAGIFLINDPLGEHDGFPSGVGGTGWGLVHEDRNEGAHENRSIPYVALSPDEGAKLLGMSVSELRELQKRLNQGPQPQSFELDDRKASVSTKGTVIEKRVGRNVVAQIPGKTSQEGDEHLVIGAHYDHLGTRSSGNDQIFNGADDNASGTAAVLELARIFSRGEESPERTLVFVFFTAEETGLLGSRFYVKHPAHPLQDAEAMMNFDMVGHNDGQVFVHGAKKNVIFQRMNSVLDRNMPDTRFKSRGFPDAMSDHTSFLRHEIPVLFYFTGLHEYYHDVGDEVDQIQFSGLQEVVRHSAIMIDTLSDTSVEIRGE